MCDSAPDEAERLEGSFVAGATRRVPDVAGGRLARSGRRPRLVCNLAASATGVAATACATLAGGRRAGDLCRCVSQARADLVDLELDARALLALFGLVRTLLESTGGDDARPLGEGSCDVL